MDAKNTSLTKLAWQSTQIRLMTGFMGKYGETFFPDSIHRALVYNAPSGADFIWKLVKPALSFATQEKVQIISGSGHDEIAKHVAPSVRRQLEELLPP